MNLFVIGHLHDSFKYYNYKNALPIFFCQIISELLYYSREGIEVWIRKKIRRAFKWRHYLWININKYLLLISIIIFYCIIIIIVILLLIPY